MRRSGCAPRSGRPGGVSMGNGIPRAWREISQGVNERNDFRLRGLLWGALPGVDWDAAPGKGLERGRWVWRNCCDLSMCVG